MTLSLVRPRTLRVYCHTHSKIEEGTVDGRMKPTRWAPEAREAKALTKLAHETQNIQTARSRAEQAEARASGYEKALGEIEMEVGSASTPGLTSEKWPAAVGRVGKLARQALEGEK